MYYYTGHDRSGGVMTFWKSIIVGESGVESPDLTLKKNLFTYTHVIFLKDTAIYWLSFHTCDFTLNQNLPPENAFL